METQNHILKYRQKHPRCRYCQFKKVIVANAFFEGYSYWECALKDKPLKEHLLCVFLQNIQGCFCRWFIAKEDDIAV